MQGCSLYVLLSVCVFQLNCSLCRRFMLRKVVTMTDSSWIIWLPSPSTGDWDFFYNIQLNILFIMSSQHVVNMKENLSLNQWNAARAANSGSYAFSPGVYQKQLGFGTGVEKCVRTMTVLMAGESLPHTMFLIFPLLHCHNLRCTSPLHPAIPVYTVWVRKQQRCSTLFISSGHSLHPYCRPPHLVQKRLIFRWHCVCFLLWRWNQCQ